MTTQAELKQRLLTPGPTAVPEAVLQEMALPIIHHRTKQFEAIYAEVSQRLQRVFQTQGPVLSIAGSGTTAFEAAQVSLIKPGTKSITVAGGKFGERWQDVYDQYGIEQVKINVPWGQAVTADQIAQALEANPDVSVVALVHSETSTTTACDLKAIAAVTRQSDALLIADGITSVGAMEVDQDGWGVDVLVTGSQKALMLPPGLGFVGLGERALARLKETKGLPSYNLDLRRWLKTHAQNTTPFTPPVSLIRGLRVALELIENEGLQNVWARTARLFAACKAAADVMGLSPISQSPSLSATGLFYPQGVSDKAFRNALRDKYGIYIAGGQDGRGASWSGKIFRISHMGYVDAQDTLAALEAVETELRSQAGDTIKGQTGEPLEAARKILSA